MSSTSVASVRDDRPLIFVDHLVANKVYIATTLPWLAWFLCIQSELLQCLLVRQSITSLTCALMGYVLTRHVPRYFTVYNDLVSDDAYVNTVSDIIFQVAINVNGH